MDEMNERKDVLLLLNAETMKVSIEKRKPVNSEFRKIHLSRKADCRYHFYYGKPFDVQDIFMKKNKRIDRIIIPFKLTLPEESVNNLSILKSALQKCVRRKDTSLALSCAKALMAINFKAFVRRLFVIIAEDVYLDEYCYTLVWMMKMIAMSSYEPSKRHMEWLLGYVVKICEDTEYADYGSQDQMYKLDETVLQHCIRLFINSTELMEGDEKMLIWYHDNWSINPTNVKIKPVELERVMCMTIANYPIVGIDYHTHSYIPGMVRKPEMSEQRIRELIWKYRSGINKRKPLNVEEKEYEDYKMIEKQIEDISRNILRRVAKVCKTKRF